MSSCGEKPKKENYTLDVESRLPYLKPITKEAVLASEKPYGRLKRYGDPGHRVAD